MDKGIQKLPRRKGITQDITVASQVVTQLLSSVPTCRKPMKGKTTWLRLRDLSMDKVHMGNGGVPILQGFKSHVYLALRDMGQWWHWQ